MNVVKFLSLLPFFVFLCGVGNSADGQEVVRTERKQKKVARTQCVSKEELSKEQLKKYKGRGVCRERVDGNGYACVKKGLFKKGDCVLTRVASDKEKTDDK